MQSPGATLQGVIIPSAMLKIVFLPHFILFCFFNAVWALTSGGFRIGSVAFGVDKLEWWGYPTMKNFEDT